MAFENILFERQDGIAVVTFNRPRALNALNQDLLNDFSQALDEIEADPEVCVLVLTGAGPKAFVAGADINEINRLGPLGAKMFARRGQRIVSRLQGLPIPVIAAVNGYALGGGSEMALACDFIYASEKATFGLPEITLGIIPGFGGTQRLPRLVGTALAKELIFTGRMLPAAEAREIGMINRVCDPETLMEEVFNTAHEIAAKGRVSLRAAKQVINAGTEVDLATGLAMEVDGFAFCLASPDAKEGTGAFLAKRKPKFSGGFED